MKKFGYIYQYNEDENKGILVYGKWRNDKDWYDYVNKDLPIKFDAKDCLTKIKTGQLVYFELLNNKASRIEKASLANFDRELIEEIIGKENGVYDSEYFEKTNILFEDLSDILAFGTDRETANGMKHCVLINEGRKYPLLFNVWDTIRTESFDPMEDFKCQPHKYGSKRIDGIKDYWSGFSKRGIIIHKHIVLDNVTQSQVYLSKLPNTIDDLYECFGKYEHYWCLSKDTDFSGMAETLCVDILNLALWTDIDFEEDIYFGKNVEEIKFLYEVFVRRIYYKRISEKEKEICYVPQKYEHISKYWQKILGYFGDEDLKEIIKVAPGLQPALPISFCNKNIGMLSDEYGMPDIEISKLFYHYLINEVSTVSEYKQLKEKLYIYKNCSAIHDNEDEGVPPCKMGKEYINHLMDLLEERYQKSISTDVIKQASAKGGNNDMLNWDNTTLYEVYNLELFLEKYKVLEECCLEGNIAEDVLKRYKDLSERCKAVFKIPLTAKVNEFVIAAAQRDDITPYLLHRYNTDFEDWLSEETKKKVFKLVSGKFDELENLDEINWAYKEGYVTIKQYIKRIKIITKNYTAYEFSELFLCLDGPKCIRWYIVTRMIRLLLDVMGTDKWKKVFVAYDGEEIREVGSLLTWLEDNSRDDIIYNRAVKEICYYLPKEDDRQWCINHLKEREEQIGKYYLYEKLCQDNSSRGYYGGSGSYGGSYAQDVMEYSDDDIDTIFDGDPDAYWNID